jgi:cell wall-active antibiotic response 4TMS protein YvqF
MRIRRGLLFWGVLLLPLGAVPLLVRAGLIDVNQLADAWRLWPILLIAVGLAILVGRSRASLAATVAIALVLGTFGGAALASGTTFWGSLANCTLAPSSGASQLERTGTFSGSVATVRLELRCGSLDVHGTTATTWRVQSTHRGPGPSVTGSAAGLAVVAAQSGDIREDWIVELPAGHLSQIDLTSNAAGGTFRLDGLTVDTFDATMNAGDLTIDAGTGSIGNLDATVNAGRIRLSPGSNPLQGSISVNAGAIDLCVPADVGLRIDVAEQLTFVTNLSARGLTKASDGLWVRPSGGGPTVSLRVSGGAAALTLNPDGGCR